MHTIQSKDNPTIKEVQKLLKNAKYRMQSASFVIEGARLCEDALLSGLQIKILFATQEAVVRNTQLLSSLQTAAKESYLLPGALFKTLADTKTPQGVLCVCKMPDLPFALTPGGYIALETVQDPSNMGTILRTAEALGINGVILSKDCCDMYSPKVLRGSMGALFRLPVKTADNFPACIAALAEKGAVILGAVPQRTAVPVTAIPFDEKKSYIALIGNEGNGLTQQALAACKEQVTVPMRGRAESLNAAVAAAVVMWEMQRQNGEQHG